MWLENIDLQRDSIPDPVQDYWREQRDSAKKCGRIRRRCAAASPFFAGATNAESPRIQGEKAKRSYGEDLRRSGVAKRRMVEDRRTGSGMRSAPGTEAKSMACKRSASGTSRLVRDATEKLF